MQFHYFSICKVNCLWFIKYFQVVPHWICFRDWKAILQNLKWWSEYATAYFIVASSTYRVFTCPQPIFNLVISKSFLTLSKGRSWGYWAESQSQLHQESCNLMRKTKEQEWNLRAWQPRATIIRMVCQCFKGGFLFIWAWAEMKRTQKEGIS